MDAAAPSLLAAMLALGLASGLHCAGMCGGVVTAFSTRPIGFVREPASVWPRQLAFNAGRISSYAVAGAAVGFVGGLGAAYGEVLHAQVVLYVLANVMLVVVGLHLAGVGGPIARIEALGAPLWRLVSPHAARLLDARALPRALLAGAAWEIGRAHV